MSEIYHKRQIIVWQKIFLRSRSDTYPLDIKARRIGPFEVHGANCLLKGIKIKSKTTLESEFQFYVDSDRKDYQSRKTSKETFHFICNRLNKKLFLSKCYSKPFLNFKEFRYIVQHWEEDDGKQIQKSIKTLKQNSILSTLQGVPKKSSLGK